MKICYWNSATQQQEERDATPDEIVEIEARRVVGIGMSKAATWELIKTLRDKYKAGGVLVAGKWYHSDDASRIQQIGLVMMGAAIPADLQWKTMDGTFVTMTQALAGQVFNAVAAQDQITFARAEQHRTAMEASSQPADYDFSIDWPAVYETSL